MASIFLSYPSPDVEMAQSVANQLKERGHSVFLDQESIHPGSHWYKDISRSLKEAEVFIALVTPNSDESYYFNVEVAGAISYLAAQNEDKLILPIVIDRSEIPNKDLNIYQGIFGKSEYLQDLIHNVDTAIVRFSAVKLAEKEKNEAEIKAQSEALKANAADYVNETVGDLTARETELKGSAKLWYGVGFASLLLSVVAVIYLWLVSSQVVSDGSATGLAFNVAKGITIVGLMLTISRYCFLLGKGYMTEALKNSDRIHAISFGKFYLQVYGGKVSSEEMREVFQNWNTNGTTEFSSQNVNDVESKILDALKKGSNQAKKASSKP